MLFSTLALLVSPVLAHITMMDPPPYNYIDNPHTPREKIDYTPTQPLRPDGSNFPCKENLFGKPGGESVATWKAGTKQTFKLKGGAYHDGGSCQASFSYDGGKTFRVVKTWIGGCPAAQNQDMALDFNIPANAANGDVIFSWTWFNRLGVREMYQGCATVTITGGSSDKTALDHLPKIFEANNGNGCTTVDSRTVKIPNPGNDVVTAASVNPSDIVPPTGTCDAAVAPVNPPASGSSSSAGSSSSSASKSAPSNAALHAESDTSSAAATSSSAAPSAGSSAAAAPATQPPASSAAAGSSSGSASGSTTTKRPQCKRRVGGRKRGPRRHLVRRARKH